MAKEKNFEETLARLEDIVEELDGGDLGLDQALKLYEEGVSTAQVCLKRLEDAKKRIQILTRDGKGNVKIEDVSAAKKKTKKK